MLIDKIDFMQEQIGNLGREMKILIKINTRDLKKTATKINAFYRLMNRLNTTE